MRDAIFGPTALVTPANAVTLGRLLAAPALVALIIALGPSWWTVGGWGAMAGTDWVDGWMARRHGATRSGAFLDPLADKFLVLGALGALVVIGGLWWVPVALIALREVAMSFYRSWAGRRGVSVPARGWAKLKTWAQVAAVGLALVPPVVGHVRLVVVAALWLAVALTLWTGALYLMAFTWPGRREVLGPPVSFPVPVVPGPAAATGALAKALPGPPSPLSRAAGEL